MRSPIGSTQAPILLIAWRRPHTVKLVIDALRPLAPADIFVACDAARVDEPGEVSKVAATRQLIDQAIDWPCRLRRLYSHHNLGCSQAPIQAIDWFFSHVEEGIILEDDCVPHPDFFHYCAALLEHYRTDHRIWCISGNNFQGGIRRGDGSYYFSRYANCWGWATWRSRWQYYDVALTSWPQVKASDQLTALFPDPVERRYWTLIWDRTFRHLETASWWDYQWQYQIFCQHALSITPNVNLVRNIGFGEDASHTLADPHSGLSPALVSLGDLIHPAAIVPDSLADQLLFYRNYLGGGRRSLRSSLLRMKSILLYLLEQIQYFFRY